MYKVTELKLEVLYLLIIQKYQLKIYQVTNQY